MAASPSAEIVGATLSGRVEKERGRGPDGRTPGWFGARLL